MEDRGKRHQELNTLIDVLIIDNGNVDQKILSIYLKEYDVSFEIVEDKEVALKKLNDLKFKMVLIDVDNAELEAYNLVKIIRKNLNIPIVAIVMDDLEEAKTKCFRAGINGCFTKPISKIELVGVLTQFSVLT